jgi:integrase
MRKDLTEDLIDALKAERKRYICMDKQVPWLGVRVSPKGKKSFVMVARFNSKHPTRRSLGKLTLEAARGKARDWHKQLQRGIDPKRARADTFGDVCKQFIAHMKSKKQRRVSDFENCANLEFLPKWRDKPMSSITKGDLLEVIDAAVKRGSPYAAHNAWAHARRLWNWAIGREIVDRSPCDRVRPSVVIGAKAPRQRVLSDIEIKAMWRACERSGSFGKLCQLILATATRRSEPALADRAEITDKLWTVPLERHKSGMSHLIPLSQLALDIIAKLPDEGRLFRITTWSKSKKRLDRFMFAELRKLNPKATLVPWCLHDLRRTARTRLSPLTSFEVAELILGHSKRGLQRVYDQHEYLEEMSEALDAWSERLHKIVGA